MAMPIDESRQQCLALHVRAPVELFGPFVAALEQFGDFAVGRHQQPGELNRLAVLVHRHAVDVIDQGIGESRGCQREQGHGGEYETHHFGNLLTSALVSCRAPPIFCTSA
jgi:hypothetical protein